MPQRIFTGPQAKAANESISPSHHRLIFHQANIYSQKAKRSAPTTRPKGLIGENVQSAAIKNQKANGLISIMLRGKIRRQLVFVTHHQSTAARYDGWYAR